MDIAIQLYTVRDRTATDMVGTLEALAEIGYTQIEPAGYGNSTPTEMRAALDRTGMSAISAHVPLDRLLNERPAVIEEMKTLGVGQVIVPWLPPEKRTDTFTTSLIGHLNELAAAFDAEEMSLGYHNHDFEFAAGDGPTTMDRIIDETNAELVKLQIDLGWAHFAGTDPIALIERCAGRVPTLHCKDLSTENGPITTGDGILAWSDIIAAGRSAGTSVLIVENDQPDDSLDDATRALANVQRFLSES